jgi:hypothetical protein
LRYGTAASEGGEPSSHSYGETFELSALAGVALSADAFLAPRS